MFKRDKHVVVSTRSLLKNRDIRRLRKDICDQWGCHVDELNVIMPAKVSSCMVLGEKAVVHLDPPAHGGCRRWNWRHAFLACHCPAVPARSSPC